MNSRKFFFALLLMGTFSCHGAYAESLSFTDVDGSFFEEIHSMKEWGIFNGYEDGTFRPFQTVNRAELVTVLVRSANISGEDLVSCAQNAPRRFSDVPEEEWYADYVYCANAQGWISGDNGRETFRPSELVSMAEAFKMLLESQYDGTFNTVADAPWDAPYTQTLLDSQIISQGHSSYYYTFVPDSFREIENIDSITSDLHQYKAVRQDIAILLYRIRTVLEDGDGEFTLYNPLISADEYQRKYGASIQQTPNKSFSIRDPHFNFELENLYLGEIPLEEIRFQVVNPSGLDNGSYTILEILYPTNSRLGSDTVPEEQIPLISIRIEASQSEMIRTAQCLPRYFINDLWKVDYTMCGWPSEDDGSDLNQLFKLRAYDTSPVSSTVNLSPVTEVELSPLHYMYLIYDVFYSGLPEEDNVRDLIALNSEDDVQEEVFAELLTDYLSDFEEYDYKEFLRSFYEDRLEDLIFAYEHDWIDQWGETFFIDVRLNQTDDDGYFDDVDLDTQNMDLGDIFSEKISFRLSSEMNPFLADEGSKLPDEGLFRLTIRNRPVNTDFIGYLPFDNYIYNPFNETFVGTYDFEILEIEKLEESEISTESE